MNKTTRRCVLIALALAAGVGLDAGSAQHSQAAAQQPGQARSEPAANRTAASVKIGNYFVDAPYGIAIIVNDETAFLIDPVWDERGGKTSYSPNDAALVAPGTTAPDFSFAQATFRHAGANIRFTWGRSGPGGVAATLESDRPVALSLRLPTTWPQFHTIYTATRDGLTGYGIAPRGAFVPFALRADPPPARVQANVTAQAEVVLALDPGRPARFVAGVGDLAPLDRVEAVLNAAGERYAARRVAAEGDWGDFLGAIADNLNNARLYGSDNTRIAHSCGRGWWLAHQRWFEGNADIFPYFLWDYFFHGLLASLEDPKGGRDTVRAVLSFQTPAGFIPSFSHWGAEENTYVTMHRSMPPVGAMAVWKMHERWPDQAFLSEVYPRLVRWHEWWLSARDGNHNGLLEWGSEQRWWQGAQYETGWDDNVHFEGTKLSGTTMNADAVDLSSLWSMDAEYLARMAAALGKTADARRFETQHAQMNKRINDRLWNDELGIYCSRFWEIPPVEGPALDQHTVFKDGFEAVFYRDSALTSEATRRRDARIDFDWGEKNPADGISANRWSARWTGRFTPPETGLYRFRIGTEESVRLLIDGRVVDKWMAEPDERRVADLQLEAGKAYSVSVEYFKDQALGSLHFSVHRLSPGQPGSDWLTRLTPMNFYPLICKAPDKSRAGQVLAWMYREDKFWLSWLIPTVPKDDPVWPKQSYWRGHIWPPANYLVWLGVQRYADPAHQIEFARRSVELFMRNWRDARVCCENYRSTNGTCGNDPHYTWGTLLNLIGVEALAEPGADFRPVPREDSALTEHIVMRRVPFGGKLYRIETRGGKVSAEIEK
jgi:hypothetical protein